MRDWFISLKVAIEFALSKLCPPRKPSLPEYREVRRDPYEVYPTLGSIGTARPKEFRDGIDRHFRESVGV